MRQPIDIDYVSKAIVGKRPKFLPRAAAAFVRRVPAGTQATCRAWWRRAAAKRAGVNSAACSAVALWGSRLITSVR